MNHGGKRMNQNRWEIIFIDYALCVDWSISRRSDRSKRNYLIKINDIIYGEFAPNIHFLESHDKIVSQIDVFLKIVSSLPESNDVLHFCRQERKLGNFCLSFLAGIEMACLNYYHLISSYLPFQSNDCRSSMSVPIMKLDDFNKYSKMMDLYSFDLIKIKSNENLPVQIIEKINSMSSSNISIDYNEAISSREMAKEHLVALSKFRNIKYIEQPFEAGNKDLYYTFKEDSNIPIFIDETVTSQLITEEYQKICDGINFKVMKSGGLVNTLKQIDSARKYGLKCMLGCMVESSLSISTYIKMSHLVDYCDLDGSLFLLDDPFKIIKIKDGTTSL
jgi:L-Ala-D/L-Glu epimerase